MTFDEANKKLDESLDLLDYTFLPEHLDEILKILQQEYAPTVEMTKEQYEQFVDFRKRTDYVQTHAVTLHDKKTKYPDFLNDLVGGVYGRLFLQAWLHPETIQIIDEEK